MKLKHWTKQVMKILAIMLMVGITSYLALWHTNTKATIEGLIVENFGLEESLNLFFDVSHVFYNSAPGTARNYIATVNTVTDEITAFSVSAYAHGNEYLRDGLSSFYSITPLVWYGQENHYQWAGVPFASGGSYIIRDRTGKTVHTIQDRAGVDNHELLITDDWHYVYFSNVFTPLYNDLSISCLPPGYCRVFAQSIVSVNQQGEEIHRYSLLDYYERDDLILDDVYLYGENILYDVTHANSIRMTPDNDYIVSVRHTNEVLVIDRETGALIWRSNDYTFTNDRGFDHQHDAQILENGNLLLFDNGNSSHQTRAVEYAVDHEAKTMSLVWSYQVDHWQPNRGSVRQTPDGNYLINFVQRTPATIVIVSPSGELLYSVSLPAPYSSYRADYEVIR